MSPPGRVAGIRLLPLLAVALLSPDSSISRH
jgi:hypothetical protein